MIEFYCNRHYKKDNTPIITDLEIMDYAEAVVGDYKRELLLKAGAIDPEHFIENYVGAELDYQDLYYEEGTSPIAGATVFNDEKVLVFDRENMLIKSIDVRANTIIIDNSTVKEGKEGFARFTELHEAGHALMHPCVYKKDQEQLSTFGDGEHVVKCKRSAIEGKTHLITQEDFREHQANVFAAAVAMPRPTFIPLAKYYIKKSGCANLDGIIVSHVGEDWYDKAIKENVLIPITEIFQASLKATEVRLKQLGLLLTQEQYESQKRQVEITF